MDRDIEAQKIRNGFSRFENKARHMIDEKNKRQFSIELCVLCACFPCIMCFKCLETIVPPKRDDS